MKQLKNGSRNMRNCLNIGMNFSLSLTMHFSSFYIIRYTSSDPDYNSTVRRASNPAPPPVMTNWPPVSRGGRRPRDRSWYGYVNPSTKACLNLNDGCLGDHLEGIIIIKEPATMTTGRTGIMKKPLKDIVAVSDNDFNKG